MKAGVIYANLIVAGRDGKRLTPERFRRMAECENVQDAVKILYEAGYGEGLTLDNAMDYDALINSELNKTIALFDELNTDESVTYCYLSEYLYHNAKVYYKAGYGGDTDAAYAYFSDIKDGIAERNYRALPIVLEGALTGLDELFREAPPNPRKIDTVIDKAYYADVFGRLKKINNKSVRAYFSAKAELNNLNSILRAKLLKLPAETALDMIIPSGGNIDYQGMYEDTWKNLPSYYAGTEYEDIAAEYAGLSEKDAGALISFEVARDNRLIEIIKRDIDNYFKIDGIIYYYVSRLIEIKTARMVLVLLNNKINKQEILKRIRNI